MVTHARLKRDIAQGTYSDMVSTRKSEILHLKEGQRLEVPGGYLESLTITPEFARELLQHKHPNQRLVRHRHVEALSAAMTAGRWHITLDPIKLDEELRVIDGQHRLLAVIKAGTPQSFLIAILTNEDAFYAIDQNAPRSLNDIRATLGKKAVPRTISGAIQLEARGFQARTRELMSKEQTDQLLDNFPFMEELRELDRLGSKARIIGVGSLGAAIAAIRMNRTDAMKFFGAVFQMTSVIDGEEVPQAHMLYMFLHMTKEKGKGRTTGEHYLQEAAWKSLRAWNAWRGGEMLGRLQYEVGAKFPKARR